MLQLKGISKSYTTGNFTQVALDGVSISFRDNEFAAILGPSGSGKTTLLNIIGGLDHYDTGDLVIDGISTKDYTDRDWDTFRNNRIGFVFQSYNLIPHQTILANVELALTLSGVGREERTRRATEALERVGLGQHIKKRPNQLSGGQMQRVAIARALVNDPEILLADEPTGALDSKTSVQIMDLLTEIANDRLVIMVTHNPELADEYATRIVNLADGHILNDTDPFTPTPAELAKVSKKKVRRTSMSFLTALSLSFNNLMTKKGRTIMTAFAGSIGIIGIAAILALANGVNNYIKSVEEETLSSYPLQITSTGFDMTSMMTSSMGMGAGDDEGQDEAAADDVVGEMNIMNRMFDSVGSNDLASLKAYLESGDSGIWNYASDIEYKYNVTPYIYLADTEDGVQQVNPDTTFASMGMGSTVSSSAIMSTMMSTDMFAQMLGTIDMANESYEVKAGHWPEQPNECVLVLSSSGKVSDFLLYILGLRDRTALDEMVRAFVNEEEVVTEVNDDAVFTYQDFLDLKLKLVCSADFYQYDEEFGVWVDKSDDEAYMKDLVARSGDVVISGIIQPKEDAKATFMNSGIYYTPELTKMLISEAGQTQVVQDQLAEPAVDVFTDKQFAAEDEEEEDFGMESLFTVDEDALQDAFKFDSSALNVDTSGLSAGMDPSSMPSMPMVDFSDLQLETEPEIDQAEMRQVLTETMMRPPDEQNQYLAENLPRAVKNLDAIGAEAQMKVQMRIQQVMGAYVQQLTSALSAQMASAMQSTMAQLSSGLQNAMTIDADAFANAFQFDMTEDELRELIMSMMTAETASFDNNLAKLDYAQLDKPYEIDIFCKDFDAKAGVTDILDAYNDEMNSTGQEAKAITYTDIVGALMSSVTTIIDMISYVLIAFVSISLVVSSIMIGVITYISVLERRKEIGILRAIGASKGNISQIFNAETVIEGLISGLLGVGITALCCIPASAIVHALFDVPNVASLPWMAGVVLVAISVFLSFIAGLIPASSASRKDPVEALRSE